MPIKAITEHVDEVMGGTSNVIYLFDAGEADGIKNPAVLREIERLQMLADKQDWLVRKTYSIVDVLKELNQAFHSGDPAWYKVPETRELVAQYLILYEMSGGEDAEELVSSDYRHASLELRNKLAMTSETSKLVQVMDAELGARPLEASEVKLTGIGALWLVLLDYIVSSKIQSFLLAFGVIAAIMISIFRSVKTGLLSMVPNLSPVLLTLGVMGWFGIALDYSKISIAAVAIGIAVDDTIHLVSRYRHEFLIHGDYAIALRAALQDVGRALLITSAALVGGFLVFLFSVMDSQSTFGVLLATTIVTALIADFLLMPALILTFQPFGPEGARAASGEVREAA
jgi:predicted RND superfamily exporter protein